LLLLLMAGCNASESSTGPGDNLPAAGGPAAAAPGGAPAAPAGPTPAPSGSAHSAAPPLTTAPPPGDLLQISFDDLNLNLQPDVAFRPWMLTERAQELDGKTIRISGYMLPHERSRGIQQFVLLRNLECKFGPGGQADHLANVTLREGITTSYTQDVIEVEGVLTINPFEGPDGNTWSIYDLDGTRVRERRP